MTTLTADPESLTALTHEFVRHSDNYRALGPNGRRVADSVVDDATADFGSGQWSIVGYKASVKTMARGGWLTPVQEAFLVAFADVL